MKERECAFYTSKSYNGSKLFSDMKSAGKQEDERSKAGLESPLWTQLRLMDRKNRDVAFCGCICTTVGDPGVFVFYCYFLDRVGFYLSFQFHTWRSINIWKSKLMRKKRKGWHQKQRVTFYYSICTCICILLRFLLSFYFLQSTVSDTNNHCRLIFIIGLWQTSFI